MVRHKHWNLYNQDLILVLLFRTNMLWRTRKTILTENRANSCKNEIRTRETRTWHQGTLASLLVPCWNRWHSSCWREWVSGQWLPPAMADQTRSTVQSKCSQLASPDGTRVLSVLQKQNASETQEHIRGHDILIVYLTKQTHGHNLL